MEQLSYSDVGGILGGVEIDGMAGTVHMHRRPLDHPEIPAGNDTTGYRTEVLA